MIRLFLRMSSDAGNPCSSIRARLLRQERKSSKCSAWYESLGHACRVLDVVRHYSKLDGIGGDK